MGDNKNSAGCRFSVDEILTEARTLKNNGNEKTPAQDIKTKGHNSAPTNPDKIAEMAKKALEENSEAFPDVSYEPEPENKNEKKKKKFSFFRKRKKGIPEIEEDIYYGLQLKSLEDYRNDYNNISKEKVSGKTDNTENKPHFSYLFNDETNLDDEEIDKHFEQLHKERKNRVETIMREHGIDYDEFNSENTETKDLNTQTSNVTNSRPATEPTQPTVPHIPENPPKTEPQPKPEIEPEPVTQPEIQQPITDPVSEPSQPLAPPSPLHPDAVPTIRCENSSEEPVKEPVISPEVKKELPLKPEIREPEKPVPRSVEFVNYVPLNDKPTHVILLDNLSKMLKWAEESYPPPNKVKKINIPPVTLKPPKAENSEPPAENEETEKSETPPEPIPISDSVESEEQKPPKKKKRFHLFGTDEEENDLSDNLPGEQDELDDYFRPSDAPSISHSLNSGIRKFYLKSSVTALCMVLLISLSFIMDFITFLPIEIQSALNGKTFLILNIVFLLIAALFCISSLYNGIKGLLKFQANSDSGLSVAVIAVLIQNIVLMFSLDEIESGSLHLYSVLVVTALFFNCAGKLRMIKRINKNFRFVAAPDSKQSVQIFDDHNTSLQMAKGCVIDTPIIAYQTKSNFLKHFLRLSYATDASDRSAQNSAPLGFIMSLILCIISLILWKDVSRAVTVFAASSCICIPVFNLYSINKLINSVCKLAYKCGAMVVGYPTIEHFCGVNAVIADAKDLFPKGTVVLNYIKTFEGQRIDQAIIDATALTNAVGGPLSDMFDQIIKSSNDILPKIENTNYEENMGISGWVEGKRIFVGNRDLLKAHGIEPPSHDYEEKYLRGGKKTVYLASGGELVAMFVVTYNSDRQRAMELRRMENNGISLILHTCDPNITPELISSCFGLDINSVRILSGHLENIYNSEIAAEKEYAPALMATKGRPTAMMRLLTACVRQNSNISVSIALQNIASIIGFLLIAVFTFYSGFSQLSANALLIYELFWALVLSLVPKLRKP